MSRATLRLALLALVLGGVFALAATGLPHSPAALRAAVPLQGVALLATMLGAWVVLTPSLISATPLAMASGLLLGAAPGAAMAIAGATLGGIVAFVVARRFGHGAVESLAGARLTGLQERLARRGFVAILLARIAPTPATVLHYAAGLSRVRLVHFAPAIALGGAPRHAAYAGLGASGGDLTSPLGLAALGLLALVTVATAAFAWRRRVLRSRRQGRPDGSRAVPAVGHEATGGSTWALRMVPHWRWAQATSHRPPAAEPPAVAVMSPTASA